jgi:hypothetical protein
MDKEVLAPILISALLFSTAVVFCANNLTPYLVSASSSTGWSRTYGGADLDSVEAVIQTSEGGYALAGRTKSFGSGDYEFWLIKTDSLGNLEWNKTYGAGSAYAIVQTSDGGYVIGGSRLVKTDSGGNIEWEKNYSSGIISMVQTSDGGYVLTGSEFWLAKTDALGELQWERNHDGPEMESAQCVIQTSEGGYAIAGYTRPGAGEGDFLLIKTDPLGEMEWSKTYGSQDKDEGHVVVQTRDGGYALAGLMWNRSGGDAGLVKTDSTGNIQWKRNYGEGSAWAMTLTIDGGYIMACSSLVKIDSEGKIQWNQPYEYGSARYVIQTSDGGYVLTGTQIVSIDDSLSGSYAWLIKTDPEGFIPEFPSWAIMPLLVLTIVVVISYRKKMYRTQTQ